MRRVLGVIFLLIFSTTGCKHYVEDVVCYTYWHTSLQGWDRDALLAFRVDTLKQKGEYNWTVSLRTTDAFPYQNLWLVVERKIMGTIRGTIVIKDTLVCPVADMQGNRLGMGINLYQSDHVLPSCKMEMGEIVAVKIGHIMSRQLLPGISDVGLLVELQ